MVKRVRVNGSRDELGLSVTLRAMNLPSMRRNQFLDFAKGLLILLVTIGHAIQFAVYQAGEGFWSDPLFKAIYQFHMPLFMGISGYLAFGGIQKVRFSALAFGKLKTYILPLLAWAVAYTLVKSLFTNVSGPRDLALDLLREFFDSFWFIWALFGCLIVTALIKALAWRFWPVYSLSWLAVLLLPEMGDFMMIKYMYPFFQIGYALAYFGLGGVIRFRKWLVAVAAVLSVVGYLRWSRETYIYNSGMGLSMVNLPNIGLRCMMGISMSVLAISLFKALYGKLGELQRSWVSSLGADSIFIYMIQVYIFVALSRVVPKLYAPLTNFWLGTAAALVIGVGITLFCLFVGRMMSRSRILAAVFFGKYPKRPSSLSSDPATVGSRETGQQ
jgi:fucose 4-O-acetylase-like acetyltransferase